MTNLLKSRVPIAPPVAPLTTCPQTPCFRKSSALREATNTVCTVFRKWIGVRR